MVEGTDKFSNLFGSILYPQADKPVNLAEQLVAAGLAKVRRKRGCV